MQLYYLQEAMIVPDLVIKCRIKKQNDNENLI